MNLFTGLTESAGDTTETAATGVYLGESSHRLRTKKQRIVTEILGGEYAIKRPDIVSIDLTDSEAIFRFIAMENLECAFHCDPLTGVKMVADLSHIIAGTLPQDKEIHISLHHNYLVAKIDKPPSYLLAYFEVHVEEIAQDPEISGPILQEFRSIYNRAQEGS
ncbi:MAG: hypothetical protein PHU93_03930 [Candidatus Gracilibacteria bacterium]|nr:hypothetical protein [Candidatus Gracilibacteria bacterium]